MVILLHDHCDVLIIVCCVYRDATHILPGVFERGTQRASISALFSLEHSKYLFITSFDLMSLVTH